MNFKIIGEGKLHTNLEPCEAVSFTWSWAMVAMNSPIFIPFLYSLTTQIKPVVFPLPHLLLILLSTAYQPDLPCLCLPHSSAGGSTQRPWSFISWIRASVAFSIAIPRFTTVWRKCNFSSRYSIIQWWGFILQLHGLVCLGSWVLKFEICPHTEIQIPS